MEIEASSFKDTDAVVFIQNGEVYRKISPEYINTYKKLINSGLYQKLRNENLIVEHEEISSDVIKPERIFISYPWEWCFSELKFAALATLKIQKIALNYSMSLKDANCFNIQFKDNMPLLIDTSSFEEYIEEAPWGAYKQFCENFIAPLALMSYTDINLNSLFLSNINGIPLELASKLLPFKTNFNFNLYMHIHLHSKMNNKYSQNASNKTVKISKNQLICLIDNLINTVKNIPNPKFNTEWGEYYKETNYTDKALEQKKEVVNHFREIIKPKIAIDFGANTGMFSRIFSQNGVFVFSLDIDKSAVEKNYLLTKNNNETNIFPLVFDLINPSPALGWNNKERKTLLQRLYNIDVTIALALIHHLRITYNIPLSFIAQYFSQISKFLIIEFVNKNDSKVKQMLINRKDIFSDYNQNDFENIFSKFYKIIEKHHIDGTQRTLYLMENKSAS